MNYMLHEINKYPNINITVSLGELYEAINYCVTKTKQEFEQIITDANTETYYSIEQVAKIFNVHKTTLWRWNKQGYLSPVAIGGKRCYKNSDIQRILKGGDYEQV